MHILHNTSLLTFINIHHSLFPATCYINFSVVNSSASHQATITWDLPYRLIKSRCLFALSVSQKIWLNFDHFRNCREFNSVWRISLAFANRPILHYGNGLRNIGGEAPPARIKVPSAFGKYAPFSIKAPPAR